MLPLPEEDLTPLEYFRKTSETTIMSYFYIESDIEKLLVLGDEEFDKLNGKQDGDESEIHAKSYTNNLAKAAKMINIEQLLENMEEQI